MHRKIKSICVFAMCLSVCVMLEACVYNPFSRDNNTTGNPLGALIGASAAGGAVAVMGGTRPWIIASSLAGGAFGYYMTTLRNDAAAIIRYGGIVYQVGDFVGIYIPTDCLFESNTAEFLPKARAILDSVIAVLLRYPDNNVIVSGSTSGFYCPPFEVRLSEKRAERVAAFIWNANINHFQEGRPPRRLSYVGYGDFFPLASTITNNGIRQNSRIQIISYPTSYTLQPDQCQVLR